MLAGFFVPLQNPSNFLLAIYRRKCESLFMANETTIKNVNPRTLSAQDLVERYKYLKARIDKDRYVINSVVNAATEAGHIMERVMDEPIENTLKILGDAIDKKLDMKREVLDEIKRRLKIGCIAMHGVLNS